MPSKVQTHGVLESICVRPAEGAAIRVLEEATIVMGQGIQGDHHTGGSSGSRQVTLIQAEHLAEIGRILGRDAIDPRLTRRNLVVRGIDLDSLVGQRFTVGTAILVGTGDCAPCQQMEKNLGAGGLKAMVGRGGLTASVVAGGTVRLGDRVARLAED